MTRLFQIVSAALLGLALIVPATAQDGPRPKERPRKEKHDIDSKDKRGSRDRNNDGRDNRDRGGRDNRDNDRRDRGRRGERPNGFEIDLQNDF